MGGRSFIDTLGHFPYAFSPEEKILIKSSHVKTKGIAERNESTDDFGIMGGKDIRRGQRRAARV